MASESRRFAPCTNENLYAPPHNSKSSAICRQTRSKSLVAFSGLTRNANNMNNFVGRLFKSHSKQNQPCIQTIWDQLVQRRGNTKKDNLVSEEKQPLNKSRKLEANHANSHRNCITPNDTKVQVVKRPYSCTNATRENVEKIEKNTERIPLVFNCMVNEDSSADSNEKTKISDTDVARDVLGYIVDKQATAEQTRTNWNLPPVTPVTVAEQTEDLQSEATPLVQLITQKEESKLTRRPPKRMIRMSRIQRSHSFELPTGKTLAGAKLSCDVTTHRLAMCTDTGKLESSFQLKLEKDRHSVHGDYREAIPLTSSNLNADTTDILLSHEKCNSPIQMVFSVGDVAFNRASVVNRFSRKPQLIPSNRSKSCGIQTEELHTCTCKRARESDYWHAETGDYYLGNYPHKSRLLCSTNEHHVCRCIGEKSYCIMTDGTCIRVPCFADDSCSSPEIHSSHSLILASSVNPACRSLTHPYTARTNVCSMCFEKMELLPRCNETFSKRCRCHRKKEYCDAYHEKAKNYKTIIMGHAESNSTEASISSREYGSVNNDTLSQSSISLNQSTTEQEYPATRTTGVVFSARKRQTQNEFLNADKLGIKVVSPLNLNPICAASQQSHIQQNPTTQNASFHVQERPTRFKLVSGLNCGQYHHDHEKSCHCGWFEKKSTRSRAMRCSSLDAGQSRCQRFSIQKVNSTHCNHKPQAASPESLEKYTPQMAVDSKKTVNAQDTSIPETNKSYYAIQEGHCEETKCELVKSIGSQSTLSSLLKHAIPQVTVVDNITQRSCMQADHELHCGQLMLSRTISNRDVVSTSETRDISQLNSSENTLTSKNRSVQTSYSRDTSPFDSLGLDMEVLPSFDLCRNVPVCDIAGNSACSNYSPLIDAHLNYSRNGELNTSHESIDVMPSEFASRCRETSNESLNHVKCDTSEIKFLGHPELPRIYHPSEEHLIGLHLDSDWRTNNDHAESNNLKAAGERLSQALQGTLEHIFFKSIDHISVVNSLADIPASTKVVSEMNLFDSERDSEKEESEEVEMDVDTSIRSFVDCTVTKDENQPRPNMSPNQSLLLSSAIQHQTELQSTIPSPRNRNSLGCCAR